jgi:hypothetical protein
MEDTSPKTHYELGVKSVSLLDDVLAVADMLRNKKLRLHEWAPSMRGVRCDAYLSKDDLLPLIVAFLKKGSKLFKYPPKNHS